MMTYTTEQARAESERLDRLANERRAARPVNLSGYVQVVGAAQPPGLVWTDEDPDAAASQLEPAPETVDPGLVLDDAEMRLAPGKRLVFAPQADGAKQLICGIEAIGVAAPAAVLGQHVKPTNQPLGLALQRGVRRLSPESAIETAAKLHEARRASRRMLGDKWLEHMQIIGEAIKLCEQRTGLDTIQAAMTLCERGHANGEPGTFSVHVLSAAVELVDPSEQPNFGVEL